MRSMPIECADAVSSISDIADSFKPNDYAVLFETRGDKGNASYVRIA